MAELEAAADAAVVSVKKFEDEVTEAEEALKELEEQAERLQGQLTTAWATVEACLTAFSKAIEAQRVESGEDGQRAQQALGEVTTALGTARGEGEAELLGARDELLGFGQRVDGVRPTVANFSDDLRTLAQSVADRAGQIETQLDLALNEARDFLGVQMVEDLRGIASALQERGMAVEAMVTTQCVTALDAAYQDFETKVGELETLIEEKAFTEPADHAREVVEFSIGEYRQAQNGALEVLAGNVRDLELELANLTESLGRRRTEIDTDKDAFDQEAQLVESLAADMAAALNSVKALMASYTFVEF